MIEKLFPYKGINTFKVNGARLKSPNTTSNKYRSTQKVIVLRGANQKAAIGLGFKRTNLLTQMKLSLKGFNLFE